MKIDNFDVYDLEKSIKASKYPMAVDIKTLNGDITETVLTLGNSRRGSGHDNFLHGITVNFDLTCSLKMWIEMQRYHFKDIVSSQSTVHRITDRKSVV